MSANRTGRISGRASRLDDRGNASIEYALLAAVVGLGILSALKGVKSSANFNYEKIAFAIGQVNSNNETKKTSHGHVPT